jgi:S-adenosylmethionine/arginine decarboxylase-like enzyme
MPPSPVGYKTPPYNAAICESDSLIEKGGGQSWYLGLKALPVDDNNHTKEDIFKMNNYAKPNHPETKQPWGLLSCIDLYECDPEIIRNDKKIKQFVAELCDLIKMKRFGETQVVHFGEDERVAGYSMIQLIETSLISAHFANQTNATYLDVFSCKLYEPQVVADFTKRFFRAEKVTLQIIRRAAP